MSSIINYKDNNTWRGIPALRGPKGDKGDKGDPGSGGGTSNYPDLTNKPSINSVTLSGNKTASDLGLAKESDIPDVSGLASKSYVDNMALKTINGESIKGSGNIVIQGGSGDVTRAEFESVKDDVSELVDHRINLFKVKTAYTENTGLTVTNDDYTVTISGTSTSSKGVMIELDTPLDEGVYFVTSQLRGTSSNGYNPFKFMKKWVFTSQQFNLGRAYEEYNQAVTLSGAVSTYVNIVTGTGVTYDNFKISLTISENAIDEYFKDKTTILNTEKLFKGYEGISKMTYLYVSANGSDEDGNGSASKPFATLFHANESITDASENNKYTIIVGQGTYTDLQEKYSGIVTTSEDYQGIICKDYVYYESENVNRPDLCVIEWDGITGITESERLMTNVTSKCPFHLSAKASNGEKIHGHIKGFTFKCKNTRYALHVELNGQSIEVKYEIENCIFEFGGRPDCTDTSHTGAVAGCGGGYNTDIKFKNCLFKALTGYETEVNQAWFIHTNRASNGVLNATPIKCGMSILLENCNFGGLTFGVQTVNNIDYDSPNLLTVKACKNATRITNYKSSSATQRDWEFEQIGNNFNIVEI